MDKNRFKIFFGIILVFFFVIFCKLFYVQIIEGGKYGGISDNKRIRTVRIDTLRGTIHDRNGLTLAVDKHSFVLTVLYRKLFETHLCLKNNILPELSEVKDSTSANHAQGRKLRDINQGLCKECHHDTALWVTKVAEVLEIPYIEVFERTEKIIEKVGKLKLAVERRNKRKMLVKEETIRHTIVSDIPWKKVAEFEVQLSNLPDVKVGVKPVRWYRYGDLAAHAIGYVGKLNEKEIRDYNLKKRWFDSLVDNDAFEAEYNVFKALSMDTLVGRSGIEKVYNSGLMGVPGERFEEITLDTLEVKKLIIEKPPIPGNNFFLTIDSKIQRIAEKALGKKKGSVVVMDPWNGEVLAMASFSRYNINTLNKDFSVLLKDPANPFLNRPIQGVLPPGSAFKIITAIAALEEKKINEDTHFACSGSLKMGGRRFRCYSKYGHGMLNIEEAIQLSCNVFFFEVAKRLGGSLLKEWSDKFGFGNLTDIDLPYEKKGKMPKSTSMYETLNLSIGQGSMLVTPIQVTRMIAMIANGGWIVKPHLLQMITDYEGKVLLNNKLESKDRIGISEKNLKIIKRALRKVVTAGTARGIGLKELHVAGKTGTAETADKQKNHAWFVGYAPFDEPKYCFTVVIEHTPGHGGDVAGPIVRKLLSELDV